jgi:hypothetical protein
MTIRLAALIAAGCLLAPAVMATPPAKPAVDCKDAHNKDKPECKAHDDHGKKPH